MYFYFSIDNYFNYFGGIEYSRYFMTAFKSAADNERIIVNA